MRNKANAAEVVRRTSVVYAMLLEGQTRAAIVQYAADQWLVSARTADAYIARCRDDLRLHLGFKNAYALGLALKGLTDRYTPIAQYTEQPTRTPRRHRPKRVA
jgi:hypothetical protein